MSLPPPSSLRRPSPLGGQGDADMGGADLAGQAAQLGGAPTERPVLLGGAPRTAGSGSLPS